MTEVLTVPTHFGDLSELSTGLVDRVDEGSLILYGPVAYVPGDYVNFRVLLADESMALEGVGRVQEVYDGGDEREPETRYDIVFDGLQLNGRNEVVYERIVLARQSMMGDAPPTGEVDISEFEGEAPAFDDATDFVESVPPAGGVHEGGTYVPPEATMDEEASLTDVAMDSTDYGESYEPPDAERFEQIGAPVEAAPDIAPPQMAIAAPHGSLGRPVFASTWWPRAEAPEPRPSTGWFQYDAGSLPVPAAPPRPELSSEQRVSPAPRPDANAPEPAPKQIDLPSDGAEIAPAVESDYVSVGDVQPVDEVQVENVDKASLADVGDEAIFADVNVEETLVAVEERAPEASSADGLSSAAFAESADDAAFHAEETMADAPSDADDGFDVDFDDESLNV